MKIRLGISTCPNDTFTFHALMNRLVDWRGLEFQVELLDIEQLNTRLFSGKFDIAKASFHTAALLANETRVLATGSALGFGVGPLLLASQRGTTPSINDQVTLCPGKHTTASLLFQLFYQKTTQIKHTVFSDIMPALRLAKADFGVCIHEGRFTWKEQGLALIEDLGTRWETETKLPLPLGGILVRSDLDLEIARTAHAVIKDSLHYALDNRDTPLPTMRQHAQEFDDDVLMKHVDLYVNDWTVDLGPTGRSALAELSSRAHSSGLLHDECKIAVLD